MDNKNNNKFSPSMTYLESIVYGDRLHEFSNASGGEGTVYFLSDDLIVKEYYSDNEYVNELMKKCLKPYVDETNKLREQGIAIPQIFECKKIKGRYYLLEERAKGRELFNFDVFTFCKNFYYKEGLSIENVNNKEIAEFAEDELLAYIDDFILTNEYLESMSEEDLEKFIIDTFNIYKQAEYMVPDVTERNVFLDKESGTLQNIDPMILDRTEDTRFGFDAKKKIFYNGSMLSSDDIQINNVIADMIRLFRCNSLQSMKHVPMYEELEKSPTFVNELENHVRGNVMACEAAIKKIIRVYKKALDNPTLKDDALFKQVQTNLEKIFGKGKEVNEILNMIVSEKELF